MNENVVDVLIFIYEHLKEPGSPATPSQRVLREELNEAGFPDDEIDKALAWLDDLASTPLPLDILSPGTNSFRMFSAEETRHLDTDARGLMLVLEQSGLLSRACRELVLERVLALDTPQIGIEELRWIILMVLANRPGQEIAVAHLEDLVFKMRGASIH